MNFINHYESPLGKILLSSDGNFLTGLWFEGQKYFASGLDSKNQQKEIQLFKDVKKWLDVYFSKKEPDFYIPIKFSGTEFQKDVWNILRKIPYGKTTTYGQIAIQIAKEKGISKMSAQAVGNAASHNKILILVPCHRLIGKNKNLTGFSAGLEKKQKLLELEKFTK